MKKFYFYLLLLFIVGFNAFATENIINSIQIEGTQRIDIETVEEDNKTILKLTVDETDKGKIIGKNGKIAKSIRNVLKLASTKNNNKYILEIT